MVLVVADSRQVGIRAFCHEGHKVHLVSCSLLQKRRLGILAKGSMDSQVLLEACNFVMNQCTVDDHHVAHYIFGSLVSSAVYDKRAFYH